MSYLLIAILYFSTGCRLCALLISSLLWFAVVPLRDVLAFGLVFSVLLQELFRLLIYILLQKQFIAGLTLGATKG